MEYVLGINLVLFTVLVVILGIFSCDEAHRKRREQKKAADAIKNDATDIPLPEAA